MSKTIPIPVQVPDWTTHIAQDEDGFWSAFENKPSPAPDETIWAAKGRYQPIICLSPNHNWRETLLRDVE